ncbi:MULTISPECIES: PAAR domain-containing protein [Enterobacter]|jgi:uncharacterized protein (TIGR03034 family)|uniref:PAAR domain-containing protein n=1 Tax=Enterobacter TaxID=547 RepID=UPI0005EEEE08|nr:MULTISPECIES: PAAR domain-containing protein [Enterobacter]AYA14162.1 DUF3289 domain-containing protein [Enterobacter cloacae]ELN9581897.1 DUF3289 family protein [Enterobacter roggenkampii]KJM41902.1 hypothetical protein SS30_23955 [Enterobacter roggenkampii]KTI30572.1 hypothetical protein ASV07_16730 [Enterobacter roggenkampii]KUQ14643.1 hypothetical protein AWI07_24920 [Enterobacter roggenkampii]
MALEGYFLFQGDRTVCGGKIITGAEDTQFFGRPQARESDKVTCGKHPGIYRICGGMGDMYEVGGVNRQLAGSIESYSSCPCRAKFIPQDLDNTYEYNCNAGLAAERDETARKKKLAEEKEKKPEPMPLPARIYTTQRMMDDYGAKDMHHGDLSEEALKGRFGLTDVSAKVNPYTLTLSPRVVASPYDGFYSGSLTESAPVVVSREESARLMFDEFRELAKVFSFHGPYKNIITEMINHMQKNSGTPYSSPLLDKALKEQILNDRSGKSSLLRIQNVLKAAINYEYGFIPLDKKDKLFDEKGNFKELSGAVLPKFDHLIDRTNGLVITVHDTWSTHITLQSLEVTGNSYRAKVHYRIQDHFGLDDADILNPVFHQGRIFRTWFVLQRYVKYGYRPFITEMNTTVEISGRRDE